MAKLTKTIREDLIRKVVKDVFTERRKELGKEESELAKDCYMYNYGEFYEKMMELPVSAFSRDYSFRPEFYPNGDYSKRRYRKYISYGKKEDGSRISFPEFSSMPSMDYIPEENDLYKRYQSYEEKLFNLESDEKTLKSELTRMLASVTTFKRLREVWPAGAKWIDAIEPPAPVPMVINTTKLNELICEAVGPASPCCEETP